MDNIDLYFDNFLETYTAEELFAAFHQAMRKAFHAGFEYAVTCGMYRDSMNNEQLTINNEQ